jgi:hypothetical protein
VVLEHLSSTADSSSRSNIDLVELIDALPGRVAPPPGRIGGSHLHRAELPLRSSACDGSVPPDRQHTFRHSHETAWKDLDVVPEAAGYRCNLRLIFIR